MGVIDTLSAGFDTVNRRLPLIALPVLLDVFLWQGPRLSIAPLVGRLLDLWEQVTSAGSLLAGQARLPPDQVATATHQFREAAEAASAVNLFELLAWQLPSLGPKPPDQPMLGQIAVAGLWWLLPALLGLGLGGLLLAACYLEAIARVVRGERFGLGSFAIAVVRKFWRLLGFFVLTAVAGLLVGLPLALVIALVGLISPEIAGLIVVMAWSGFMVLALLLFFVGDAIFVGEVGPVAAARQSVELVRQNLWPAIRFAIVSLLIIYGTLLAWRPILGYPVGVAVAIVGNAYIASGLVAASMIFYRDRYRRAPERAQVPSA